VGEGSTERHSKYFCYLAIIDDKILWLAVEEHVILPEASVAHANLHR
jgi:hypothetical protein